MIHWRNLSVICYVEWRLDCLKFGCLSNVGAFFECHFSNESMGLFCVVQVVFRSRKVFSIEISMNVIVLYPV